MQDFKKSRLETCRCWGRFQKGRPGDGAAPGLAGKSRRRTAGRSHFTGHSRTDD
jgi:hypothetical protein